MDSDIPPSGQESPADSNRDPMAPPPDPCECWCLHCGRTFMSDRMWFQRVVGDPDGFAGFWMCPTPNCSGAGFSFDIFPTDPSHPANEGWHTFDDEDDDDDNEEPFDEAELEDSDKEYDPAEPKYKELDEWFGEYDDDLEGEEWKHGLEPGARPPPTFGSDEARREWEQEQRMYDQPDQRPRELDWSHRESRRGPDPGGQPLRDDDIPF